MSDRDIRLSKLDRRLPVKAQHEDVRTAKGGVREVKDVEYGMGRTLITMKRISTTKLFSLRSLSMTGLGLAMAGIVGLVSGVATAKPPTSSKDKNGHYWCEFDNANGGRKSQGPFNKSPDCSKVCESNANGINCNEASTVFVPNPNEAPQAPQEHTKQK